MCLVATRSSCARGIECIWGFQIGSLDYRHYVSMEKNLPGMLKIAKVVVNIIDAEYDLN
jgi:hypothetical protein